LDSVTAGMFYGIQLDFSVATVRHFLANFHGKMIVRRLS
jgi:hypothetical protein